MATQKTPQDFDPNTQFTITTDKGRVIEYRELDAVEEFRMNSLLGASRALNPTTANHAMLAIGARKIDGTRWDIPINEEQLIAALRRLGKDGYNTLYAEIQKRESEIDSAKVLEDAGNLPANPA